MESVNFSMLGDPSIAESLGKKGTSTDLTLYDKKESGIIRTWVAPNGFPEKIQPLMQAINLAEYAVVNITTLDKFAGEIVLALDILQKHDGILLHSYDVDEGRLESMIAGTVLEKYKRSDADGIREALTQFKPTTSDSFGRVIIDHCFDVKGAGTVVLGKVESGMIKQYDELTLLPSGSKVMIKSIQMHDDPATVANSPANLSSVVIFTTAYSSTSAKFMACIRGCIFSGNPFGATHVRIIPDSFLSYKVRSVEVPFFPSDSAMLGSPSMEKFTDSI